MMSQTTTLARLQMGSNQRPAHDALNDALLNQASLLSTLVSDRSEARKEPVLGQAELVRLVKAQQSFLSAHRELPRMRCVAENVTVRPDQVRRLAA